MKEPILLSWSGGKDSALALHELRRSADYEVAAIVTTVTEDTGRIGMHAVPRELVARQGDALGVPLREISMPAFPPNDVYEARWRSVLEDYQSKGIHAVAFGDLFLEDIRDYRERFLGGIGMRGVYPIWRRETPSLAREFIDGGFRAVLVAIDLRALDRSFAGRPFDRDLLADLPPGVDPCGENGEFHTFVFDGPEFLTPVPFHRGEVREDGTFAFCDLSPA
jgi:uncharacterized protein (TIGR00290 family)